MKLALKISIGLNLSLLGGLIFLLVEQPKNRPEPEPKMAFQSSQLTNEPIATMPPAPLIVEPKPFRWSQLDSTDYHVYVKNLRTIGCPELTIRAIVSSDVHAVYRIYSAELKQKLSKRSTASWSDIFATVDSEQALKNQLQQLAGEEVAKINDLLGLKPVQLASASPTLPRYSSSSPHGDNSGGGEAVPANGFPGLKQQVSAEIAANVDSAVQPLLGDNLLPGNNPGSMPLIFQPVDPQKMNLTEAESQILNELRQNYQDQTGQPSPEVENPQPNPHPKLPFYPRRPPTSQSLADDLLAGLLGRSFAADYQMQADIQAAQTP